MNIRLTGTFKVEQLIDEILEAFPKWVGTVEPIGRDSTGLDLQIPDGASGGEVTALRAVVTAHVPKTEPTRDSDRVTVMTSLASKLTVLGFTSAEITRILRGK